MPDSRPHVLHTTAGPLKFTAGLGFYPIAMRSSKVAGKVICSVNTHVQPRRRETLWVVACVLGLASLAPAQARREFRGEIADSRCAAPGHAPDAAHQATLKSKSMTGTANKCSVYCIAHSGGELVLSSGNEVFRLNRPDLVRGFAGQKVKLTGVLDTKSNIVRVMKIELDNKP
jgi:hypothetical protein